MVDAIKVLDCTFRDGGYYNKWDFSEKLVQRYLHAVDVANIDIIELGFRNLPQDTFFGAFAYTTDTYINVLDINKDIIVCVMIDAKSILNSGLSTEAAVGILFQPKAQSRVDLVRIATHFDTVEKCEQIAKILKKLGYQVGLNLMQAHGKPDNELSKTAQLIQNWCQIDVLYFADSLGSMNADDVAKIILALKLSWNLKTFLPSSH